MISVLEIVWAKLSKLYEIYYNFESGYFNFFFIFEDFTFFETANGQIWHLYFLDLATLS